MSIKFKNLLFIGPHPDDVEMGCGGTMLKYHQSTKMTYVILSPCLDEPRNKNILKEAKKAVGCLGLSTENMIIKNLSRRTFHEQRKEIRDILISAGDKYKPDMVFCPSFNDIHQDHSVAAEETLRIFRNVGVLAYENPRSSINFKPNLYVELSEEILENKIKAFMCYKSQAGKYFVKPEVIRSFARMRGTQFGVNYAEAFEVLRMKA